MLMESINNHFNVPEFKSLLLENEDKFLKMINKLDVAVALYDGNTNPVLCNSIAYSLLGLTEDQFLGKTPMDPYWEIVKSDESKFESYDFPIIQVTTTYNPIYGVIMGVSRPAKNDRIWLEVNTEPILERTGELKYIICTYKEKTDTNK